MFCLAGAALDGCSIFGAQCSLPVLDITEEPVIQDSSISRVYPLASIMRLSCLVAGQPPPSIRWLKNGEEVVPVRYRVEVRNTMVCVIAVDTQGR